MNPPKYNIGDEISYINIKRNRDYNYYPVVTYYTGTKVTGIVKAIRDTETKN